MSRSNDETWSPSLALSHPLFAAALLLLIVNDHLLKGAGVLPAIVTGKLSDFAGLLVAPVVLAWIVRARTDRAWLGAHLAIGLGFIALELSPVIAALVEHASRAIGFAWRVWPDPTDLLALPCLALSFTSFGPRLRARSSRYAPLVGVLALLACTATSQQSPPARYPFRPGGRIETDVYLRHTGTEDLQVRVVRLRDEVVVDCDTLSDPPEGALGAGDFAHERTWTLARGDMIPLWDRLHEAPERECYAVRVTVHGREWLVAWRHGTPPMRPVELRLEPNVPAEPEAIVATPGEEPPRAPEGVIVRQP